MPDIATIGAALTSIKTATEIVKALREVNASLEKVETKLKIVDLLDALVEAKTKIVEIQEVLQEKDKRISELEAVLELKPKLTRQGNAYFELNEGGNPFGAPFCSYCWEMNHKAIHMYREVGNRWNYICPACKNSYPSNRIPDFERVSGTEITT
jgi:hypothetical protein